LRVDEKHPLPKATAMNTKLPICAVLVTYHPGPITRHNLDWLLRMLPQVVLVDNGSDALEWQNALPDVRDHLHMIRNEKNEGIATALNQGIVWAKAAGFEYVFLFDQDSHGPDNFVEGMWAFYQSHPFKERIGVVMPRYWQASLDSNITALKTPEGYMELMLSSGSLCPMAVFDRCGLMREDFFIDTVDYEFGLRVRDHGMLLVENDTTCLEHEVASPAPFHFAGKTLFYYSNYSADRRYYHTRNQLFLMRKYFFRYNHAIVFTMRCLAMECVKMLLAESNRWHKTMAVLQGARDSFLHRMGPRRKVASGK
jgi:rhamnosyltransferase